MPFAAHHACISLALAYLAGVCASKAVRRASRLAMRAPHCVNRIMRGSLTSARARAMNACSLSPGRICHVLPLPWWLIWVIGRSVPPTSTNRTTVTRLAGLAIRSKVVRRASSVAMCFFQCFDALRKFVGFQNLAHDSNGSDKLRSLTRCHLATAHAGQNIGGLLGQGAGG